MPDVEPETPAVAPAAIPEPEPQIEHDPVAALIDEAARKSSMLWIALPGAPQARAAWHAVADGAVVVVHEGAEQHLPGLRDRPEVEVTLRSKDKGSLLVRFPARVVALAPGDGRWEAAVAALHGTRQSAPDGEAQPERWAAESQVTRLEPAGPPVEGPGTYDDADRRAAPVPTPATTLRGLPMVIGRRSRRRPKL
jgi:hypothetical protein